MADRQTRKKQITARRQEQILKAALEVFGRKGFAVATMPEIAREAGMATGTIYLYYPSKRDLFVAVIENLLVTPLVNIFTRDPQIGFQTNLREAIEDRFQILQKNLPTFLIPIMGEIQRDPELRAYFLEKVVQPMMIRMELLYSSLIARGELREMKSEVVVRLVGGMMFGVNLLKSMEGPDSPLSRLPQDQLSEEVMNFILYGLMNRKYNGEEKNHEQQRHQSE